MNMTADNKTSGLIITIFAMFFALLVPGAADAKVLPPIGLEAKLMNDPQAEGVAIIEVKTTSMVIGDFTIKCEYGKLDLLEGACPASFTLEEGGSKTFTYRFSLPEADAPYEVRFTLKSKGFSKKTSIGINAPVVKPAGKIRKLPSGEGVRELGP